MEADTPAILRTDLADILAEAVAVGGGEAEEDALIVGALLGIRDGRGLVVLGPELGASADRVGTLCGGCEVLLLGEPEAVPTAGNIDPLPVGESERLVTVLPGVGTEAIPLLAARVLGVALVTASEASIGWSRLSTDSTWSTT